MKIIVDSGYDKQGFGPSRRDDIIAAVERSGCTYGGATHTIGWSNETEGERIDRARFEQRMIVVERKFKAGDEILFDYERADPSKRLLNEQVPLFKYAFDKLNARFPENGGITSYTRVRADYAPPFGNKMAYANARMTVDAVNMHAADIPLYCHLQANHNPDDLGKSMRNFVLRMASTISTSQSVLEQDQAYRKFGIKRIKKGAPIGVIFQPVIRAKGEERDLDPLTDESVHAFFATCKTLEVNRITWWEGWHDIDKSIERMERMLRIAKQATESVTIK